MNANICCRNENIYSIAQEINKLKNDKNYRDIIVNLNLYNASKYTWDNFSDILNLFFNLQLINYEKILITGGAGFIGSHLL